MSTRVGVVGIGNMGRHHARVYAELPDAELVGVHDVDEERAAEVAAKHGTQARDCETLFDLADAVSIAVPTEHHAPVAHDALERGVDVLVEKPLAADPETAAGLVESAEEQGCRLAVGHVERFNPAVQTLLSALDDHDVIAVDARRLGPPRGRGGSVVHDLMIHDIDVALALLDEDVRDVSAATAAEGQYATATLGVDGALCRLAASRVTQRKARKLSVTTTEYHAVVDYLDQSVAIHRSTRPSYVEAAEGIRHRDSRVVERPTVDNGEPLRKELAAFLEAVREDEAPPVSGRDGLRAVEVAARIERAATREVAPR